MISLFSLFDIYVLLKSNANHCSNYLKYINPTMQLTLFFVVKVVFRVKNVDLICSRKVLVETKRNYLTMLYIAISGSLPETIFDIDLQHQIRV